MKFVWYDTPLSAKTLRSLEEIIVADSTVSKLNNPSRLIAHHIKLGKTYYDPLLFVWGEENDPEYLHCSYVEQPQWKKLDKDAT